MKITRGDVVLVDVPFASGLGGKLRPSVVVQSNHNNRRLLTTMVVPVTSNLQNANEPTQVRIDIDSPDGAKTGLVVNSAIKCENIATVERSLIQRRIGTLSPALLQLLDDALRAALELP